MDDKLKELFKIPPVPKASNYRKTWSRLRKEIADERLFRTIRQDKGAPRQ